MQTDIHHLTDNRFFFQEVDKAENLVGTQNYCVIKDNTSMALVNIKTSENKHSCPEGRKI